MHGLPSNVATMGFDFDINLIVVGGNPTVYEQTIEICMYPMTKPTVAHTRNVIAQGTLSIPVLTTEYRVIRLRPTFTNFVAANPCLDGFYRPTIDATDAGSKYLTVQLTNYTSQSHWISLVSIQDPSSQTITRLDSGGMDLSFYATTTTPGVGSALVVPVGPSPASFPPIDIEGTNGVYIINEPVLTIPGNWPDPSAQAIWITSTPNVEDGTLTRKFYSSVSFVATIRCSIDNTGTIYLNTSSVLTLPFGNHGSFETIEVNIPKGINYIRIVVGNTGGPGWCLFSMIDNATGVVVVRSDEAWHFV
jgi:hypothetical protein